jgi:hypothetical protein
MQPKVERLLSNKNFYVEVKRKAIEGLLSPIELRLVKSIENCRR